MPQRIKQTKHIFMLVSCGPFGHNKTSAIKYCCHQCKNDIKIEHLYCHSMGQVHCDVYEKKKIVLQL